MLICHFSDWHAMTKSLPTADVYVCTGDMMPDVRLLRYVAEDGELGDWDSEEGDLPEGARCIGYVEDPETSRIKQLEWQQQHPARLELNIPEDRPVIVVRGNHDWCDLADWFGGDVWEITDDPTRTTTIQGVKFGGFRGIPYIHGGFNDELHPEQIDHRQLHLPKDLDVLVTHFPPVGILDVWRMGDNLGSPEIMRYINDRWYNGPGFLKAHLFGHIHEARGLKLTGMITGENTLFSNAATTMHLVEVK